MTTTEVVTVEVWRVVLQGGPAGVEKMYVGDVFHCLIQD